MNGNSLAPSPGAPKRRAVERRARRNAILRAAEEAFAEKGFHATSMAVIARRAGFAAGTIYLYFADKSALYGSIILEKMREMVASLRMAFTTGSDALSCLRAGMRAQFAFHETNRRFFEIFLNQHQIGTSPLHEAQWQELEGLKREVLCIITNCIIRGQQERTIREGEPKLYALAFLGMTLQMIRQWIREDGAGDLTGQASFVADCFIIGAGQSGKSCE